MARGDLSRPGRLSSTPQHVPWFAVVLAYVVYAAGTTTLVVSAWHLDWATKDSRQLLGMGLIAPMVMGGFLMYVVAARLSKAAAVFAVVGCAIGHLIGLYLGFSYVAPILACLFTAFAASVCGVAICGVDQKEFKDRDVK
jgi:hypothetical protein